MNITNKIECCLWQAFLMFVAMDRNLPYSEAPEAALLR
jgi:hypothetical protein